MAAQDLLMVGEPPQIARLRVLSVERQANLLRHWLRLGWQASPSEAQMTALLRQIAACTTRGHHIRLKVASGHVRFADVIGGVQLLIDNDGSAGPALARPLVTLKGLTGLSSGVGSLFEKNVFGYTQLQHKKEGF